MKESKNISKRRDKWSDSGVPHKGWRCINIEDREDKNTTCECENWKIHIIHGISNFDKFGTLEYITLDAAKLSAFNYITSLLIKNLLN